MQQTNFTVFLTANKATFHAASVDIFSIYYAYLMPITLDLLGFLKYLTSL